MKLRILDSGLGGGLPRQYASAYLVNDTLAIDAGCLGLWNSPEEQSAIRHVLITHSHMDHIAALPLFLENSFRPGLDAVTVYGLPETVEALQNHLFNGVIWPDFARIQVAGKPLLLWKTVLPGEPLLVNGLTVTPVLVNHVVPACGYIVTDQRSTIYFGGDSGPSNIWEVLASTPRPRTVILEASFPDAMHGFALATGHLTPAMLRDEVAKMPPVDHVIAVHMKEPFRSQIERELASLRMPNLTIGIARREYDGL